MITIVTVLVLFAILPVGLAFMVHVRIVRGQALMVRNDAPEREARAEVAVRQEELQSLFAENKWLIKEYAELNRLVRTQKEAMQCSH